MADLGFIKTKGGNISNDRMLVSVIQSIYLTDIEGLRKFNSILVSKECLRSWIQGGKKRKCLL